MSTSSGSSLGTSDIVGIIIGGVLGLATIIGIIISCYSLCCKKKNPSQVGTEHPPPNQQHRRYAEQHHPYAQPTNTGYYPQQPYNFPQQQPYYSPQQQPWYPQPAYNPQRNPYYQ